MSAKDAVIEFVRSLPDAASLPDVIGALNEQFGADNGEAISRDEWEAAWGAEAERRLADLEAGRTRLVPADEVMTRMREKFG